MSSTITFPRLGPKARLLIVDDEEPIRRSLVRLLGNAGYHCVAASDPTEARQLLAATPFDLMLCDVTMPGESGLSLLAHAHATYAEMAVLMVTAIDAPTAAEAAARFGVYGYVLKPFDTNMILINVVGALRQRAERLAEVAKNARADSDFAQQIAVVGTAVEELATLERAQSPAWEEALERAAVAAEWREPDVTCHLHRVSAHSARLATLAGLAPPEVELLRLASQMHDIGKVTIPDAVLGKTTPLNRDELHVMQGHTESGFKMLEGYDSPLLRLGALVALSHHERFDGNGYPHGLVGASIPLEGRIVAIADVYDALRSPRPYKRPYTKKQSLEILRSRRRAQLDPELLDLFIHDFD